MEIFIINNTLKRIIIYLLFFQLFNCFNKQDHQITRPEVPRYTLTITTVDHTTGLPLPNTTFNISATQLVYEIQFTSQTLQSDSTGHLSIYPIYPGNYYIQPQKQECWLQKQKVEIQHQDRNMEIKIPNVHYAFKHPKQIATANKTYECVNSFYRSFTISSLTGIIPVKFVDFVNQITYYFGKVTLKNGRGSYLSLHESNTPLNYIFQFEVGNGQYWACKKPDSIFVFDQYQYNLVKKISTGVFIRDISYNVFDKNCYVCTDSLLYSVDLQSFQLTKVINLPIKGIVAMSWHSNYLYLLQGSEDLIYKLDTQLQIVDTFAIINRTDNYLCTKLYDFDFDVYDNLWYTIEG